MATATIPQQQHTHAAPGNRSVPTSAAEGDEGLLVIEDFDQIPPFFCSLTSDANLWLFVSSTGSLTAGREDADHALLPYETVDRIHDNGSHTGPFVYIRWKEDQRWVVWQPFDKLRKSGVKRRLFKNILGSRLTFEETLESEGLVFRSTLMISDRFGLVRECHLHSLDDSARILEVIHGVRNLVPTGVTQRLQNELSCLTDAYKQNELIEPLGLGIYSMASALTDQPVPLESLLATVAWSRGLQHSVRSVDAAAIEDFSAGLPVSAGESSRGVRGHFIESARVALTGDKPVTWIWVGDTALDHRGVAKVCDLISRKDAIGQVYKDIVRGEGNLRRRLASADGIQATADYTATAHHLANVLFNLMRGGVFASGYELLRDDFFDFLKTSNRQLAAANTEWFAGLPLVLSHKQLEAAVESRDCPQLQRIFLEYLPLSFSRRHGDPSRPWNKFKIQTRDAEGSEILSFQGNWRDIFQNWEALALSFPDYLEHMVNKFVNASTADGYNPYRITRDGIDWEDPDPNDPWASFGYWGDHQIIYLLKLLESLDAHQPRRLAQLLGKEGFSYANVPYRIQDYATILKDPRNTMKWDSKLSSKLRQEAANEGSDAKLVRGKDGQPALVSLLEKILVPVLSKWSNFVPGGGIWMNTQRPEWNDANNALVGNGLSMVTLYYLRRHQTFLFKLVGRASGSEYELSKPVADLLNAIDAVLSKGNPLEDGKNDTRRRSIVDALGQAGSDYRDAVYRDDFTHARESIQAVRLQRFLELLNTWTDATIRLNRRDDGLYHAYNLIRLRGDRAELRYLQPMLEGQVAVLSAGMLDSGECVDLLDRLRASPLYCPRRKSYLLYPDKAIRPFMAKNVLPAEKGAASSWLLSMVEAGDTRLVMRENDDVWRFNPDLFNEGQLRERLGLLSEEQSVSLEDQQQVLDLYEEVFNHHAFTGRSGSMFAYEGLGSIYWHMVSKLLLAVQENLKRAVQDGDEANSIQRLDRHYEAVRDGLGYRKSASDYGAFPTDPYSHTPAHAGAQQPGMTGQVKEEVLTRRGELGVWVNEGCLDFNPIHSLIQREIFSEEEIFNYIDLQGRETSLPVPAGGVAYTVCQTPVICRFKTKGEAGIRVVLKDGEVVDIRGRKLSIEFSRSIFARQGWIKQLEVSLPTSSN